ncbi:MAG: hypothetical protein F7C07_08605, partial [Desulfurococcales archaeon]|nr:hypothetical protein [Desulfurococcales archaeon]
LVATIEERNFVQSKYGKLSHVYALRLDNPARFPITIQLPDPIKAQTWVCNISPRNRKVIKRALKELNYL